MNSQKRATEKYRLNNLDKFNENYRKYYDKKKEDPEWKLKFNERCKENNKRYREKMKLIHPPKKAIGRPRKAVPIIIIDNI
jgi:hypothetical protein